MAYRNGHAPSFGPKLALTFLILVGVLLAAQLMFGGNTGIGNWFSLEIKHVNVSRQILIVVCASLFFIRTTVCLFVFLKRKISWFEGTLVGVLYCGLLCGLAYWGSSHAEPIGFFEVLGIILYGSGSWINTLADYQRYVWKKKSENTGRLYTQGLFRYAMHINFWGDTLMFWGFALITHEVKSFIPVAAITLNFLLLQIPLLDAYLAEKYGKAFEEYAHQTKKFIPFVY